MITTTQHSSSSGRSFREGKRNRKCAPLRARRQGTPLLRRRLFSGFSESSAIRQKGNGVRRPRFRTKVALLDPQGVRDQRDRPRRGGPTGTSVLRTTPCGRLIQRGCFAVNSTFPLALPKYGLASPRNLLTALSPPVCFLPPPQAP